MQMLKNVFNSKSKYYLELDESAESQPIQAAAKTAKQVSQTVQETATEVLESKPVAKVVETANQTKDAAQEKLEAVTTTETAKPQAQTKGKVSKADKPQKSAKVSPQAAGASSFEPPFWVAAMYGNNNAKVNSDGTGAEQTFATDNLMPTISKYRRRPGPSLNNFKEMANKAKTPKG